MTLQTCFGSEMELYDFIPVQTEYPKETSFLYAPEPIGIGTPFVESLASYFIRLSAAHMLTPSAMLKLAIAPQLPKRHQNFKNTIGLQSIVINMSGIGSEAEIMVDVLEQLTGRTDLTQLTMLPFAAMLAKYELLSQTSSWCPYCFEQQRTLGQPIYLPLIWSLRTLRKCPIHRCNLWMVCPHCKTVPPVIGSRTVNGYCNKCQGWLGRKANKSPKTDKKNFFIRLFEWQNSVGFKREQQTFPSILGYLMGKHMKKKDTASMASLLHLPESIIEDQLANKMLPALGVVFWIGHVFKIDPFDILTKDGEEMAAKDLEESAKIGQIMFDMNRINWKQLEELLRDVANGRASAMRVEDIARVYRCPLKEIIARYPEMCCNITNRFKKQF